MAKPVHDSILEIRKDADAIKQLNELQELVTVPPERGGFHFSEWEKEFIKSVVDQHDQTLIFTDAQRKKIKEIWQAADLKKRAGPDEKAQNLFSNLPPERQAEMRERAKRVKLPWEQ